MGNYRSYIHVSRLWLARPSISLVDAESETWALSLSAQAAQPLGRWRAPFCHVIYHCFHLTAAAVSLSLSQTTDLTEDTQEVG